MKVLSAHALLSKNVGMGLNCTALHPCLQGLPFSSEALKELLSLKDLNDCTPLHLAILNGTGVLFKFGNGTSKESAQLKDMQMKL
eukprot:511053-Pelagomonas_calceolata.AAC.1